MRSFPSVRTSFFIKKKVGRRRPKDEESQSTTFKEFIQKLRIALREANESKYWLNIIDRLNLGDKNKRKLLMKESQEISLIIGSIVSKADRKAKNAK